MDAFGDNYRYLFDMGSLSISKLFSQKTEIQTVNDMKRTKEQINQAAYDLLLSLTPGGSEFVNDPERCCEVDSIKKNKNETI